MKVTPEQITIIPEPERREVALLLAGLRITFTADEASLVASGLNHALAKIAGSAAPAAELLPPTPAKPAEPPKAKPADSFSDDAEPPLKETIEELEKSITGMFRRKTG